MTYDALEASTAEGRPYFLYLFAEGAAVWRFTSRASAWTSPAGAIAGSTEELVWTASSVSHGPVVQSSDPRRVDLTLTFPISDAFARRYLGPRGRAVTTLTIFRGHEQVPMEVVAHGKGRVVSARTSGERITLHAESLFTAMRREGIRAKYQRLCRHALYGRGCRLEIAAFFTGGTASAWAGLAVTVAEAALLPDDWYRGGVLRHAGLLDHRPCRRHTHALGPHAGARGGDRRDRRGGHRDGARLRSQARHLQRQVRQPPELRRLPEHPRPQPLRRVEHRLRSDCAG